METPAQSDTDAVRLTELDDPEFFRHWSELRLRIALGGKSLPRQLKHEYARASAEFRRRVNQEAS
jgi:hypothetical protein